MRYGISTHLYHKWRLTRAHLEEIAASGIDRVEVFATRTHFDYHDLASVAALGGDLSSLGLTLHSVHAPIVEGLVDDRWGAVISIAAPDGKARAHAVAETRAAIEVARIVPYEHLVVHLGVPAGLEVAAGGNDASAARDSLEELAELAEPLGVHIAVEVIPNSLSDAEAVVELIEDDSDLPNVGVCLDFGHAYLLGDLAEAVETVSGLLLTTHLHDNRGREDDHLVPFEGTIDWAASLTALRKVGYEGTLMFEVAHRDSSGAVLERVGAARARFDRLLGEPLL